MTHDELLAKIQTQGAQLQKGDNPYLDALRAVVELHNETGINNRCVTCLHGNKCETIQAIEKELE